MSWDELGELASEGWEIGSHTRTHPRLPRLDGDALREELARIAGRVLQEGPCGRCRSIAYPYGDCSATVVRAAREAGYVGAVRWPAGSRRRRARVAARADLPPRRRAALPPQGRSTDALAALDRAVASAPAPGGAGCERRRPADHRRHGSLRLDAPASALARPRGSARCPRSTRCSRAPRSPSPPGSTGCRWAIASGT